MAIKGNPLPNSLLRVTVIFSPSGRRIEQRALELEAHTCVAHAIVASQLLNQLPAGEINSLEVSIWGRKTSLQDYLQDHDRVEILRSLRVDPKIARRERFTKQGAKSAGLFIQNRAGSKTGY